MTNQIAHPEWLVESDWLAAHLDDPRLRIFDCTTHLRPDPATVYRVEAGRAGYQEGHIPGAGFIDIQADLSDNESPLRFTQPSAAAFAAAAGELGIGDGNRVILYSQTSVQWATRVWWQLRSFGFDNAAVLNGGLTKWRAEKRPLESGTRRYPTAAFTARPRPNLMATAEMVRAAVADDAHTVINALSLDQHHGTGGTVYGRPGRISGSTCVPTASLLDPDTGAFIDMAEIRARLTAGGAAADAPVIAYCGGGIAASATAFLLTLNGFENVALYDNSLSEWAKDPSLPMEIGVPA